MNMKINKDGLSAFIQLIEKQDEIVKISEKVSPDLEIAELADRVMKQAGGGKALLFENNGTDFPVLINAYGSTNRINAIFGDSKPDKIFEDLFEIPPKVMSKKGMFSKLKTLLNYSDYLKIFPKRSTRKPECQDYINLDPDINELPVLKSWPYDGGKFITLPLVFTKHPETGVRNTGMYRMQVFDRKTTGMHWHRHKGGAEHFNWYKKRGEKMPVAVVLGGDPLYTYLATAPLPENIDELMMYGLIRKKPVKLAKCVTQDIEVPADADFVIEGYIDPAEDFKTEGPFGDHTGFYSLTGKFPAFHITAITHRSNAVYPATIVGIPPMEDMYFGETTERLFKPAIKNVIAPDLIDFHLPAEGVAHNLVLMQVKNKYPGAVNKTMHAMFGAGQMMFSKVILALPVSFDLKDYKAVADHFVSVISPDKLIISSGPADELEHSSPEPVFGGKLMIDLSDENKPGETPKLKIEKNILTYGRLAVVNGDFPELNFSDKYTFIVKVDFPFDKDVLNHLIWWILANTDPKRDISVQGRKIFVDSRLKGKKNSRRIPQPVLSSDEIIKKIDQRWNILFDYGFSTSPSAFLKNYINSDGAEINNNYI